MRLVVVRARFRNRLKGTDCEMGKDPAGQAAPSDAECQAAYRRDRSSGRREGDGAASISGVGARPLNTSEAY